MQSSHNKEGDGDVEEDGDGKGDAVFIIKNQGFCRFRIFIAAHSLYPPQDSMRHDVLTCCNLKVRLTCLTNNCQMLQMYNFSDSAKTKINLFQKEIAPK